MNDNARGSFSSAYLDLPPLVRADVGAGVVSYRECEGPPGAPVVLLLHGFIATAGLNWMHCFAPLASHFRVLAPDLCGHGGTAFDRRRFTFEHCADDLAVFIQGLGLERVIVVGYSMGGMVAQHLARRHGRLLSGVVLSGVDWGSREYGSASRAIGPVLTEVVLRLVQLQLCLMQAPVKLLQRSSGSPPGTTSSVAEEFSGHHPRAVGGAVREISYFRSIDWLHEIEVPTLVLVTLRDALFPQAEQRRMAKQLGAIAVREFDGGHVSVRDPEFAGALVEACLDLGKRIRNGR